MICGDWCQYVMGGPGMETSNNDKKTDEDTVIIERPPEFAEDDEEVEPPVSEPSRPEIAPDKVRRPPFESP